MPAAPVFLQLIADFVVYLGLLSGGERRSPLRISFYVGSSRCTMCRRRCGLIGIP